MKGYKKFCVSNAMDGTNNDMLCNGSEEDGNVSECQEDESTDCEDGDCDSDWKRQVESDMLCVLKCKKLIVKYFFLSRCLIFGGSS